MIFYLNRKDSIATSIETKGSTSPDSSRVSIEDGRKGENSL